MLTEGREIENDTSIDVFRMVVAKRLDRRHDELSELQLTGNQRYPDEVIEFLGLKGDEAKSRKRKLSNKVSLAAGRRAIAGSNRQVTPCIICAKCEVVGLFSTAKDIQLERKPM